MRFTERNFALDCFRTLALALMIADHFLIGFICDEPGSWGEVVLFITGSAPVFFFIAFGMTILRVSDRTGKLRSILELGILALFHQIYRDAVLTFNCDLFFFLLLVLIVSTVFHRLFENRWIQVIFASAIIISNLLIGHDCFGALGAHPFGIMPWMFFVVVGMMLGYLPLDKPTRIKIVVYALVLFVVGLAVNLYGLRYGIHFLRATISKWEPTTSAYMLIWTSIALCVYTLFNLIKNDPKSAITKIITVSSQMLLAGIVLHYLAVDFVVHYLINDLATFIMNSPGYGLEIFLPVHLAFFLVIGLWVLTYVILLTLGDIKQIAIEYFKDEKLVSKLAWVGMLILACAAIILLLTNPESSIPANIAKVGMLIAAFLFIKNNYPQNLSWNYLTN